MSDVRTILIGISPLLASFALMLLGLGLLGTGVAVKLDLAGFSPLIVGLIATSHAIGYLFGAIAAPRFIGSVGHIRVFAAFAALLSVCALTFSLYLDAYLWAALRLVGGFCAATLYTITEGWINEKASNNVRGQVLSAYMTVNFLFFGLSQGLIGVIDPAGGQMFILIAILVSLSVIPLLLVHSDNPEMVNTRFLSPLALYRISPLGCVAVFMFALMSSALYALMPVFATSIDRDTAWIAQMMLVTVASGFVFQVPIGKLSDMADRRYVLLGLTAIIALLGFAAYAMAADTKWMSLLFAAGIGALQPAIYSVAVAHTADFVEPADMVPASAGLLMLFAIGSILGPVGAGQMMTALSPSALFLSIGVVAVLLVLFTAYRMTVRSTVPVEEKLDFVPVRPTAALAISLDPRAEDDQLWFDFGDECDVVLTAAGAGIECPEQQHA